MANSEFTNNLPYPQKFDITNQQFGDWTAQRFVAITSEGSIWQCLCACGTVRNVPRTRLVRGKSTNCGCRQIANQDLTGQTFNRWTVISFVETKKRQRWWLCECECGNQGIVPTSSLRKNISQSCGCLRVDMVKKGKHGQSRHPLYHTWANMMLRCYKETDRGFHRYGGRGITVCDRWHSLLAFIEDMGERPSPQHSIDRINNNGNYCPENCRWATKLEQAENRRTTILHTLNGESRSVPDWARQYNVPRHRVYQRLKYGWTLLDALTRPSRTAR